MKSARYPLKGDGGAWWNHRCKTCARFEQTSLGEGVCWAKIKVVKREGVPQKTMAAAGARCGKFELIEPA